MRSQIAPYFVASPVKGPNVQIGVRRQVRLDSLHMLLGSCNIGRVEIFRVTMGSGSRGLRDDRQTDPSNSGDQICDNQEDDHRREADA